MSDNDNNSQDKNEIYDINNISINNDQNNSINNLHVASNILNEDTIIEQKRKIDSDDIDKLYKTFDSFNNRLNEINNIKIYLKETNKIIIKNIFLDASSIAAVLRTRVDEFLKIVRQDLKNYCQSLENDKVIVSSKIEEIKKEFDNKYSEIKKFDDTAALEEFYYWASEKIKEIELVLVDKFNKNLYPIFNYKLPADDIEKFIKNINIVDLNKNQNLNDKIDLTIDEFENYYGKLVNIDKHQTIDCIITSGITDHGLFWLQIVNNEYKYQTAFIIDEISKYIRTNRISDSRWLNFEELGHTPYIGERCFSFEMQTSKWLRARIDRFNNNKCQIRYLDTGHAETDVTFNRLLKWKDFNLNKIPFQSLQCTLINCDDYHDENYDKRISFQTRFYFKDSVDGKKFKCMLNNKTESIHGCANSDLWFVDLYPNDPNTGSFEKKSLNKDILDKNKDFLNESNTSFSCRDIRLDNPDYNKNGAIINNFSIINCKTDESEHSNKFNDNDLNIEKLMDDAAGANSLNNANTTVNTISDDQSDNILVKSSTSVDINNNQIISKLNSSYSTENVINKPMVLAQSFNSEISQISLKNEENNVRSSFVQNQIKHFEQTAGDDAKNFHSLKIQPSYDGSTHLSRNQTPESGRNRYTKRSKSHDDQDRNGSDNKKDKIKTFKSNNNISSNVGLDQLDEQIKNLDISYIEKIISNINNEGIVPVDAASNAEINILNSDNVVSPSQPAVINEPIIEQTIKTDELNNIQQPIINESSSDVQSPKVDANETGHVQSPKIDEASTIQTPKTEETSTAEIRNHDQIQIQSEKMIQIVEVESQSKNITTNVSSSIKSQDVDNNTANNNSRKNTRPFQQSHIPTPKYNQQNKQANNSNNNTCKNDSGSNRYYNNRRDDGGDDPYDSKFNRPDNRKSNQYGSGWNNYGNRGYNNNNKRGGNNSGGGSGRYHQDFKELNLNKPKYDPSENRLMLEDDNVDEVFVDHETNDQSDNNLDKSNKLSDVDANAADDDGDDVDDEDYYKMYEFNKNIVGTSNVSDENFILSIKTNDFNNLNEDRQCLNNLNHNTNNKNQNDNDDDGFIDRNLNIKNSTKSENFHNKSESQPIDVINVLGGNINNNKPNLEDTLLDSEIMHDTTYDGGIENYRHLGLVNAIVNNKNAQIITNITSDVFNNNNEDHYGKLVQIENEDRIELSRGEIYSKLTDYFIKDNNDEFKDKLENKDAGGGDDDDNDSYASCEEGILKMKGESNTNLNKVSPKNINEVKQTNNLISTSCRQPENQKTENLSQTTAISPKNIPRKSTKNFTVSIFIESFEDYSYERCSNEDNPSISNSKTTGSFAVSGISGAVNRNIIDNENRKCEHAPGCNFNCVFNSSPNDLQLRRHCIVMDELTKISRIAGIHNTCDQDINLDSGDFKRSISSELLLNLHDNDSLKDFERQERIMMNEDNNSRDMVTRGTFYNASTPITNSFHQIDEYLHANAFNSNLLKVHSNNNSLNNINNNNGLSTITECSNETFETSSNKSNNKNAQTNLNPHSIESVVGNNSLKATRNELDGYEHGDSFNRPVNYYARCGIINSNEDRNIDKTNFFMNNSELNYYKINKRERTDLNSNGIYNKFCRLNLNNDLLKNNLENEKLTSDDSIPPNSIVRKNVNLVDHPITTVTSITTTTVTTTTTVVTSLNENDFIFGNTPPTHTFTPGEEIKSKIAILHEDYLRQHNDRISGFENQHVATNNDSFDDTVFESNENIERKRPSDDCKRKFGEFTLNNVTAKPYLSKSVPNNININFGNNNLHSNASSNDNFDTPKFDKSILNQSSDKTTTNNSTLGISTMSINTDSLFNGGLVITPMCSDAFSQPATPAGEQKRIRIDENLTNDAIKSPFPDFPPPPSSKYLEALNQIFIHDSSINTPPVPHFPPENFSYVPVTPNSETSLLPSSTKDLPSFPTPPPPPASLQSNLSLSATSPLPPPPTPPRTTSMTLKRKQPIMSPNLNKTLINTKSFDIEHPAKQNLNLVADELDQLKKPTINRQANKTETPPNQEDLNTKVDSIPKLTPNIPSQSYNDYIKYVNSKNEPQHIRNEANKINSLEKFSNSIVVTNQNINNSNENSNNLLNKPNTHTNDLSQKEVTIYGLDTNESENDEQLNERFYKNQIRINLHGDSDSVANSIAGNVFEEEEEEEEEEEFDENNEETSFSISTLPPPPAEFQTSVNFNHHNIPATTSSSSTATTCRLNNIPRFIQNAVNHTNNTNSPISQPDEENEKKIYLITKEKPHNTNNYVKSPLNQYIHELEITRIDQNYPTLIKEIKTIPSNDLKEKTFYDKFDHLFNINPKRLNKNTKFFCRVHDTIDENGAFWLEVIYSKDEEIKFNSIFKLFRMCSNLSQPPIALYNGKYVSALHNSEWYRAIIINVNDKCNYKLVKVRFVDLGITKYLNYETDLRDIDVKFFNTPLKALHCTIRLNDDIEFTRDMRKLFKRLVSNKKLLIAQVIEKKNDEDIFKIILGCEYPKRYINVYLHILSRFNRIEYERVKLANNLEKNKNTESKKNNYTDLMSILANESGNKNSATVTNDRLNNALHSTDMCRLDTLNEESIESFPNVSSKTIVDSSSTGSNYNNICDFNDIPYGHLINDDIIDTGCDSDQYEYDDDGDDDDDILDQYLNDDVEIELQALNDYKKITIETPSGRKRIINSNDLGLDYTPVKDLPGNFNLDANEIQLFQERINNLNIQPVEIDTFIDTITQRTIKQQMSKKNDISSDTDTSVQVKCCVNPFKWASHNGCMKSGKLVEKTKQRFGNQK